jgi:dTDP-4-dehydrorhamnose 3,5-epimerase
MIITETGIADLLILVPSVFKDDRGYFLESYNAKVFSKFHLDFNFVQDNEAKSNYGVIRGLHFQTGDHAQTKLIRVVSGEILDVVVDLRKNSNTFGKVYTIVLNSENKKQLLIPRGMAHGYAVHTDNTIVTYKCDRFYSKENESGISIFDEDLNIDWGIPKHLSCYTEKDISWPNFSDYSNDNH